jgi:hypothetical protein
MENIKTIYLPKDDRLCTFNKGAIDENIKKMGSVQ